MENNKITTPICESVLVSYMMIAAIIKNVTSQKTNLDFFMRQQRYKLWYHPTVYDQLNICISSISEVTQCPDSIHQYLMKEFYTLFTHEDKQVDIYDN